MENNAEQNDNSNKSDEAPAGVITEEQMRAAKEGKTEEEIKAAEKKATLHAQLVYKILNHREIKAKEEEARAKVRDDEGEVLYSLRSRKIVQISEDLVVKKADDLQIHEVSNFRFIASKTTIPVPKVHDVRWENDKIVGIVMDYMPGKLLEDVWETLSPEQKKSISEQLHGYICQLRNLKGDYIGAAERGTVSMGKYSYIYGGPFDSEREFNEWVLSDLSTGISAAHTHFAKRALTEGHEIVFTHADFSSRNILVDDDCQVTAVVDWEFAGWYPEWWEYFTAYSSFQKGKDWSNYLCDIILPPRYDREFVAMSYVSSLCRT